MILYHRIGRDGIRPLKSIPYVTPVGADLTEFSKLALRNASGCLPAWHPNFPVIQQAHGAAGHVGAGELHADPLLVEELVLRNRDHFTHVPAVDFQECRAGFLQISPEW